MCHYLCAFLFQHRPIAHFTSSFVANVLLAGVKSTPPNDSPNAEFTFKDTPNLMFFLLAIDFDVSKSRDQ